MTQKTLTPVQTTIEQIVEQWEKKIKKTKCIIFFIFINSTFSSSLILFNEYIQKYSLFFQIFLFLTGLILLSSAFFSLKAIQNSWKEDFLNPISRLLKTIELIESQKLELLPEERISSFTSFHQRKLLTVARDILEHQRFIDQVIDNMFEIMIVLNADGIIQKANQSLFNITKYQKKEIIGQHIRKLFPKTEAMVDYYLDMEVRFAMTTEIQDMEVHIRTSEGEILPFSLNAVKITSSNEDLLGYTIIAKDMSDIYKLIHQVNKSNFELNAANEELAKRYDEIQKEVVTQEGEKKRLEHELETSQLVQNTLLPLHLEHHPLIQGTGRSTPATYCGGDWWNTISTPSYYYVFIGDVTGHGTPAAMVTAAIAGYFASLKHQILNGNHISPKDILKQLDTMIVHMNHESITYYMTFFVARIHFSSQKITFSNAGHCFPFVKRFNEKKCTALIARGNRLGSKDESFEENTFEYHDKDTIFFYTDGIIENENKSKEPFGKKRLRNILEQPNSPSPAKLAHQIENTVQAFVQDQPPLDDVTFVVLQIREHSVH